MSALTWRGLLRRAWRIWRRRRKWPAVREAIAGLEMEYDHWAANARAGLPPPGPDVWIYKSGWGAHVNAPLPLSVNERRARLGFPALSEAEGGDRVPLPPPGWFSNPVSKREVSER